MFCDLRMCVVVLIVMVIEINGNFKLSVGSTPGLAVDGNTNQTWIHGPCTHTLDDHEPYWEVDLGTSYVIAFIEAYKQLDCCSDNLTNVEVNVSTDHVTYARYGYHQGTIGSTYEFYPESSVVVGRWVKISLCDVEIMSNMTYKRDYLRAIHNVKGTGTSIASIPVVSKTQCVFLCNQEEACHSVNVRKYEFIDSDGMSAA